MSQTYFAILTAIGEAKLANAAALNTTLKISKMAVGDGGGSVPTPDRNQTALKGEWYRAGLNSLTVDKANSSQVIAELVIPETTGGSWIREMGLIDADGNLIAVANTPPSYKPQLAEGSGRTQVLRMVLIVSSTSNVELKIDPSVVLATRGYVDDAITVAINRLDNKQSVRAATTTNITLSGLQTLDGVALVAGDRVLVKNQSTGNQNGIYVAGAGGWLRAADADENAEVTPGLTAYVEEGATQADTIWKLITDAPITLGSTALVFADITQGYMPTSGGTFTGQIRGQTPSRFDNSKQLITSEFFKQNSGQMAGFLSLSANTTLTASSAGSVITSNAGSGYVNVALPGASTVPIGAMYIISHSSSAMSGFAVGVSGSDVLVMGDLSTNIAPYSMNYNESIVVVSTGTVWKIVASNGAAFLNMGGGFTASLNASTPSYQRLPSGFIIQGGAISNTNAGSAPITFPVAFPKTALALIAFPVFSGSTSVLATLIDGTLSKTGATVGRYSAINGTNNQIFSFYYIAIGF
jgi:phage-related tail fiber protein